MGIIGPENNKQEQDITKTEILNTKETDTEDMYYIGIGASAGGLEALEVLFKEMPNDTGMAFIVIQHLSPDYKSLMNELLARRTKMSVVVAENGMCVQPDTIYLNSPGNDITIEDGKFIVHNHKNQQSLNLPINLFFRSLAADQGKHAIAIVLSGTGSDGTLGIRAIKEAGGMIIAQDDQTAKFDGMPRSSISTGLVDLVLSPQEMGTELINYIRHPYIKEQPENEYEIDKKKADTFARILMLIRNYCGVDFFAYKENTMLRRLERRVSVNRLASLEEYYLLLVESEKEKSTLYREFLIGVTNFFRDKEAFQFIEENIIPNLDYEKHLIRVWCAACSTGEEVYSIAMLIKNYIDVHNIRCDVKIFATDIESSSLDFAGRGVYSESLVSDIDPEFLEKYFIRRENAYQIKDAIRNMVVFANHNILKDPPFSKLDLLLCRNLFIYLKPEIQQKLLSMFYYSLQPKGYLFMGSSESVGEMGEAYRIMDGKWKIYQCRAGYQRTQTLNVFNMPEIIIGNDSISRISTFGSSKLKIEKVLEQAFSAALPPTFLLDENFNIVHVLNNVNEFMDVKPGKFSNSIFSNISNDLSLFVGSILRRLKNKNESYIREYITGLRNFPGKDITVKGYMVEYNQCPFYLLTFEAQEQSEEKERDYSIDSSDLVNTRIAELEKELIIGKENLQATVEELETSNEELQSSNEELIASNEELQSTNEELQSVNEELYTVNSEYQFKIDELSCMTEDLDNLLIIAEIGALYLDCKFCIRKITPIMTQVTNIMPTDVGRPIFHISFMDNYPDLLDDVRSVLETLMPMEKELHDHDRTWLVRIRPYRTNSYAVDGVLLTLVEVTNRKQVEKDFDNMVIKYDRQENRMAEQELLLHKMLDETSGLRMFADEQQTIQYINSSAKQFFFGEEDIPAKALQKLPHSLERIYTQARECEKFQKNVEIELTNFHNEKKRATVVADVSKNETKGFSGVFFTIVLEEG